MATGVTESNSFKLHEGAGRGFNSPYSLLERVVVELRDGDGLVRTKGGRELLADGVQWAVEELVAQLIFDRAEAV